MPVATAHRTLQGGYVPAAPVLKHVRAYIDEQNARDNLAEALAVYRGKCGKGQKPDDASPAGTLKILAERVGMEWQTLATWLKRRIKMMPFDHADALLCHSVGPDVWHQDPELRAIYVCGCDRNINRYGHLPSCQAVQFLALDDPDKYEAKYAEEYFQRTGKRRRTREERKDDYLKQSERRSRKRELARQQEALDGFHA